MIVVLIPISFVGLFLAYPLFGVSFGQGGFAAMIMLCGITVNAGIYLTSEYQTICAAKGRTGMGMYIKAFNRKPRGSQDRVICQLESGWLKESSKRIKFFSSVKKELGVAEVHNVMERDMDKAMSELFMAKLAEMLGND